MCCPALADFYTQIIFNFNCKIIYEHYGIKKYEKIKKETKGTVVLSVVEGDTHEIGKNIVKIMIESSGYNVIDLQATNKANICVTNIPSYSTMAVAQHTFALMLQFSNQIEVHNNSVRNGE